MAQLNFTVDTLPMAASVDGISERILGTTAAVTTMQAAVIETERRAAAEICSNVDRGFYSLMRSQISSKLAKHFTDMNVKLSLILEYAKSLAATQNRMEADYNRIRREYLKIFRSLDKALENRVLQLDNEAMQLAANRKKLIADHLLHEAANTAVSANEIGKTQRSAVSARIKNKTGRAISRVANRVGENLDYGAQMESILGKGIGKEVQKEYVPVIYSKEQSSVLPGATVTQTISPGNLDPAVKNSIEMNIASRINTEFTQSKTEFETQEIYREFSNMVASANLNQRVKETMMKLYARGERE